LGGIFESALFAAFFIYSFKNSFFMVQVTAFTNLNGVNEPTTMASPDPLNHRIASLATNKQPDWLNAADEMASHMYSQPFEQQNEMLLRIQERLIRHRMNRIEELEKHLHGVSAELDHARNALRSIQS
jgi:hypothetical protein